MIAYDDQDVQLKISLFSHDPSVSKSSLTYLYRIQKKNIIYDEYDIDALKVKLRHLKLFNILKKNWIVLNLFKIKR